MCVCVSVLYSSAAWQHGRRGMGMGLGEGMECGVVGVDIRHELGKV